MRTAYISPSNAELSINVVREAHPHVILMLDLGIPNFTVFSLKFPFVEGKPTEMKEILLDAIGVLLDEVAAFMISMNYAEEACVALYTLALMCFQSMTVESDTDASLTDLLKDSTVRTFQGSFKLPQSFVDQTQEKVVTAATLVQRVPTHRTIELRHTPIPRNTLNDAQRVIRQYRNRTLKSQPKPLFVIVYDQTGRPAGSVRWRDAVKMKLTHNLLKREEE